MIANEKASERAARAIWACATIDWKFDSGEVARPILAEIVAMETSCDSLAEENQRLRGALDRAANEFRVVISDIETGEDAKTIKRNVNHALKFVESEIKAVEALKK